MNRIQNYGIANYQVNFQARGGKKTVKTLADKFKDKKEVEKITNDFARYYKQSRKNTVDLLEINGKTNPKELRAKVKTFDKNLDKLLDEIENM